MYCERRYCSLSYNSKNLFNCSHPLLAAAERIAIGHSSPYKGDSTQYTHFRFVLAQF